MPAKAPQEALIGSLQLLQPGIEVLYRTQREGKALHLFPLTGRERGEQFLETVQQVELAHHHVQRQARTQFITQLRQARTQHECQVTSCLRRSPEQVDHIHQQDHAIEWPSAAVLGKPANHVPPQASLDARRQA